MTDEKLHEEIRATVSSVFDEFDQRRCAEESEENKRRERRLNSILKWVVGPAVVAAVGTGGFATYTSVGRENPEDVREAVEQRVDGIERVLVGCANGGDCTSDEAKASVVGRMDEAERKIDRLGEQAIEQQIQQVDGVKFLADKIDKAYPRGVGETEKPPTLEAAEKKVDKFKKKRRVEDLFRDDVDPSDPLGK